MNREQRRKLKKQKSEKEISSDKENLQFILKTLEEFNQLSEEERLNSIEKLREEIKKYGN